MIDSSYSFLSLEKISRHLLNLGAPPVSQEGEDRKSTESSKLTQRIKTAIGWLKHDRFKLRDFLP